MGIGLSRNNSGAASHSSNPQKFGWHRLPDGYEDRTPPLPSPSTSSSAGGQRSADTTIVEIGRESSPFRVDRVDTASGDATATNEEAAVTTRVAPSSSATSSLLFRRIESTADTTLIKQLLRNRRVFGVQTAEAQQAAAAAAVVPVARDITSLDLSHNPQLDSSRVRELFEDTTLSTIPAASLKEESRRVRRASWWSFGWLAPEASPLVLPVGHIHASHHQLQPTTTGVVEEESSTSEVGGEGGDGEGAVVELFTSSSSSSLNNHPHRNYQLFNSQLYGGIADTLQRLDLSHCPIGDGGVSILCRSLFARHRHRVAVPLSSSANETSTTTSTASTRHHRTRYYDVTHVTCPALRALYLDHCDIGDSGLLELSRYIVLAFRSVGLHDGGAAAPTEENLSFASSSEGNLSTSQEEDDEEESALGRTGASLTLSFETSRNSRLRGGEANGSGSSSVPLDDDLVECGCALAMTSEGGCALRLLSLQNNRFTNRSLDSLTQLLEASYVVRSSGTSLSSCGSDGASAVRSSSSSSFEEEGTAAVVVELECIDIRGNALSDEALIAIGDGLAQRLTINPSSNTLFCQTVSHRRPSARSSSSSNAALLGSRTTRRESLTTLVQSHLLRQSLQRSEQQQQRRGQEGGEDGMTMGGGCPRWFRGWIAGNGVTNYGYHRFLRRMVRAHELTANHVQSEIDAASKEPSAVKRWEWIASVFQSTTTASFWKELSCTGIAVGDGGVAQLCDKILSMGEDGKRLLMLARAQVQSESSSSQHQLLTWRCPLEGWLKDRAAVVAPSPSTTTMKNRKTNAPVHVAASPVQLVSIALTASPHPFTFLRHLDLSYVGATSGSLDVLLGLFDHCDAAAPHDGGVARRCHCQCSVAFLQVLNLSGNGLGDRAAELLDRFLLHASSFALALVPPNNGMEDQEQQQASTAITLFPQQASAPPPSPHHRRTHSRVLTTSHSSSGMPAASASPQREPHGPRSATPPCLASASHALLLSRCSIRSLAAVGGDDVAQLARDHVHLSSSSPVTIPSDRRRFVPASHAVASRRPLSVIVDLSHNLLTKGTVLDALELLPERHAQLFEQTRVELFVEGPYIRHANYQHHSAPLAEGECLPRFVQVMGTDVVLSPVEGSPLGGQPLTLGKSHLLEAASLAPPVHSRMMMGGSRRVSWWWVAGFVRPPTFLPPHRNRSDHEEANVYLDARAGGDRRVRNSSSSPLRRSTGPRGTVAHITTTPPPRHQDPLVVVNNKYHNSSSRHRMLDTLSEISGTTGGGAASHTQTLLSSTTSRSPRLVSLLHPSSSSPFDSSKNHLHHHRSTPDHRSNKKNKNDDLLRGDADFGANSSKDATSMLFLKALHGGSPSSSPPLSSKHQRREDEKGDKKKTTSFPEGEEDEIARLEAKVPLFSLDQIDRMIEASNRLIRPSR